MTDLIHTINSLLRDGKKIARKRRSIGALALNFGYAFLLISIFSQPAARNFILSPLPFGKQEEPQVAQKSPRQEVFGFAPHWTINRLDNVDFSVLTTLAYFGVPVKASGDLDRNDKGYDVLHGQKADEIFTKAKTSGTRVVLTITQMDNATIKAFLDNEEAQQKAIAQTIEEVRQKGMDGVNIDYEYVGNPRGDYKEKFSRFVTAMNTAMHEQIAGSRVTVSVYASSAKDAKLYDIGAIAQNSDGIFMMAYDFATKGADQAMPTAPLYGHKEGEYWYDIATAVDDFLKVMPADKLILGLPWYGYNYHVSAPTVKAATNKGYYVARRVGRRTVRSFIPLKASAQTYTLAQDITANTQGVAEYIEGWDEKGQVAYKAYRLSGSSSWRMVFIDDPRALAIKYDFAKEKGLGGVGMWALGFDNGKTEMWDLLREKFGTSLAYIGQ